MPTPIVSTVEVQKHLKGSYESLARRLSETATIERKKIFGEDDPGKIRVIGTFKGHVIAVTETAKFVKVFYETASNGELVVIGAENISIPVYEGEGAVRQFARSEASAIVESFISGDSDLTQDRITDLMRTIDTDPAEADLHISGAMIEAVTDGSRRWRKQLFTADSATHSDLAETLEHFEPKFEKLTDGHMPSTQQEAYRSLVVCDLKNLVEQIEIIYNEASASFASLTNMVNTDSNLLKEESFVETKTAVQDLLAHLLQTQVSIAESLQSVNSISALGELHDAVALELLRWEAAGKHISRSVAAMTTNPTL